MQAALDARSAAAPRPVAAAGSMSSFCPAALGGDPPGEPPGAAWEQTWFPGLADFREQAQARSIFSVSITLSDAVARVERSPSRRSGRLHR